MVRVCRVGRVMVMVNGASAVTVGVRWTDAEHNNGILLRSVKMFRERNLLLSLHAVKIHGT